MENRKHSSHHSPRPHGLRPLLTQTENNTTLWIGHLKTDPTDHFAGQTFTCPSDGMLNNIQVYSSAVNIPGEVSLTLHVFDPATKTWGSAIGHSSLLLQKGDDGRWIRFELEAVPLKKEATYGFRLQTRDAMVGLGEAAHHSKKPFLFGWAWTGDSKNQQGHFFNFFSLAFKVECA